ncbi:MAG: TetR/AcrR family transcriptional regulator [Polyangiaceae bacterium]
MRVARSKPIESAPKVHTSSRVRPRKYHHGDLRRAILDVALEVLAKEGAEALTLREVARRLGVTSAAPYHHFADKEAILAAVAEEGFLALVEAMKPPPSAKKPIARLRSQGMGYVKFAVEHPAHYRVMFGRLVDIPKYPSLHAAADQAFEALVGSIVAAQAAKAIRPGDAVEHALLAWSTVHGLAMLWIDGALRGPTSHGCEAPVGAPSIEALAEAASEMLIRGLA